MAKVVHTRPVLGVLAIDHPFDRLQWGPLAGRVGWQAMDEWKSERRVVLAADITASMRAELGLRHPLERVHERFVHTRAAMVAMPVLAIHPELWGPLAERGCRLLLAGYHRTNGRFRLEAEGPGWPAVRIDLQLYELFAQGLGYDPLEAIDRLLRAVTSNVVSELAVRAADLACKQVDPLLVTAGGPASLVDDERFEQELRREHADDPEVLASLGSLGDHTHGIDFSAWEESYDQDARWGEPYRATAEALVAALEPNREGDVRPGEIPNVIPDVIPDVIMVERRARPRPGGKTEPQRWQRFDVRRSEGCTLEVPGRDGSVHLRVPASIRVVGAP